MKTKGKKEEKSEISETVRKTIKAKKKTEPMVDKKDNYEKKPSDKLKKKRTTSSGYMPR